MEAFVTRIDGLDKFGNDEAAAAATTLLAEFETASGAATAGAVSTATKARAHELRGRIKTYIPATAMEAESDLIKSLKMKNDQESAWLALAEAQWRRGAFKEAMEAAESAVRCAPQSAAGMALLSRMARSWSTAADVDEGKRKELRELSVSKAREAVAKNTGSAAAWQALALALFSYCTGTGTRVADLKRALAAATQATRLDKDAVVMLNRGIMEHSLLLFADAMLSFNIVLAREDPMLKTQANTLLSRTAGMAKALHQRNQLGPEQLRDSVPKKTLVAAVTRGSMQRPNDTILAKWAEVVELQKTLQQQQQQQLPAGVSRPLLLLVVLRLISGPSDSPLVYETVTADGIVVALAVSNLLAGAIPVATLDAEGRIPAAFPLASVGVICPPAELVVTSQTLSDTAVAAAMKDDHKSGAEKIATITKSLAPLHSVFVSDPSALIIDGSAPDPKFFKSPTLSFALTQ